MKRKAQQDEIDRIVREKEEFEQAKRDQIAENERLELFLAKEKEEKEKAELERREREEEKLRLYEAEKKRVEDRKRIREIYGP